MFHDMLAGIESIATEFNSYVNPETESKPMSNWVTQLFGNRPVSANATWTIDGESHEIEIRGFQPARDADGNPDKGAAGDFRKLYASRGVSDDNVAQETLRFATYAVASFLSGQLPSPKRISAESTLKAEIVKFFKDDFGLELESLTLLDGNDSMTHEPESVYGVMSLFNANAQRIRDTWNQKQGRGRGDAGNIDWL